MTPDEMLADYYAWVYHEKPAAEEFEDEDFDLESVKAQMASSGDEWEDVPSSEPVVTQE